MFFIINFFFKIFDCCKSLLKFESGKSLKKAVNSDIFFFEKRDKNLQINEESNPPLINAPILTSETDHSPTILFIESNVLMLVFFLIGYFFF